MDKNLEINWLNIISNREFISCLDLNLLTEISMMSKLIRQKLNPILFKNLILNLDIIKFDSNVITIANDSQALYDDYDYNILKQEKKGDIENSLNDFIIALNNIKKYTKSFFFDYNLKAGYYLYPLVRVFDNLTDIKIFICDIPFKAFADIGKSLPNLNMLELENVSLINSTRDVISAMDIVFPPNLNCLKLYCVHVITTSLLSDPYEYLFNKKAYPTSYESFILPKISIPTLKQLDFQCSGEESRGLEEFLDINPNVECLLTRDYNLKLGSGLNSLKSLDNDDLITFHNISQGFRLNSINSLAFTITDFSYSENIRKLIQLCPNITNLSIHFLGNILDFQPIIDNYLDPTLSSLNSLKTLVIIDAHILTEGQILDFTKFTQIEKLKILVWGSTLSIKFDKCESLRRIELISYEDNFTDEFKKKFNRYNNWTFKFSDYTVKGYKI